jgi:hypothetical protein
MEMKTTSFEQGGEEGLTMVGSEYITDLSVLTTQETGPETLPGDTIFSLPLAPRFYPGTRFKRMSTLFQKYRFNKVVFECIPIVPATQNGALIGFITHDPVENYSIVPDGDVRLRNFMAHHGAHMWNVFNYGNMVYTNDDTIQWYFTGPAEDGRLESQGNLMVAAASTFTPFDGSSETITLCQLIMHYEVEYLVRKLEDDGASALALLGVQFSGHVGYDTMGTALIDANAGAAFGFNNGWCNAALGLTSRDADIILVIRALISFGASTLPPPDLVDVDTDMGTVPVFSKGSIWYGFFSHTGIAPDETRLIITSNLQNALARVEDSVVLANSYSAEIIEGTADFYFYNMEMS